MLNEKTLQLANEVAQFAVPAGKKIIAKPGSPLAKIVEVLKPDEHLLLSSESVDHTLGMVLDNAQSTIPCTDIMTLPFVLEAIERDCMEPWLAQLSFVRNEVNPLVKELLNYYHDALGARKRRAEAYTVVKHYIPALLLGTSYFNYIKNLTPAPGNRQGSPSVYPALENIKSDVMDFVRSESDDFNEQVLAIGTTYTDLTGSDVFKDAWELLLSKEVGLSKLDATHAGYLKAIIAFIMVDNLKKNPVAGLNVNEEHLANWANYARGILATTIVANTNILNATIQNGTLILNTSPSSRVVVVNGEVYDNWTEGNESEVLIGILNSEDADNYRSVNSISENRELLVSRGRMALQNANRTLEEDLITDKIDAIHGAFIRLLDVAKADEAHVLRAFGNVDEPSIELRSKINGILNVRYPGRVINMGDVILVLTDLLCELYFKETMASVILSAVVNAELKYPDASSQDLFSIAVVELLTEWVAGQIMLVNA